jgi:uncharacterized protein (TIGR02145 family)
MCTDKPHFTFFNRAGRNLNQLKKKLSLILVFLFSFCCNTYAQTVTIGNQVWMTKNLDVSSFRNGDPIPEAKSSDEWYKAGREGKPVWCYYNNNSQNGVKYGKLYNWFAVADPRGLAPEGWKIPSKEDFTTLWFGGNDSIQRFISEAIYETEISFIDEGGFYETKWIACNNCSYWTEKQKINNPCTVCKNERGKYVKTGKYIPKTKRKIEEQIQVGGWNGTNETGFSAVPGGMRKEEKWAYINLVSDKVTNSDSINNAESFSGINTSCYWWVAANDKYSKWAIGEGIKDYSNFFVSFVGGKESGLYVRCIRSTGSID